MDNFQVAFCYSSRDVAGPHYFLLLLTATDDSGKINIT